MKKKTIVPLIVFLLGICLVGLIVYKTDSHETDQQHITAQLNATTYGERIKNKKFCCHLMIFDTHQVIPDVYLAKWIYVVTF